jgi:hypothetical protein
MESPYQTIDSAESSGVDLMGIHCHMVEDRLSTTFAACLIQPGVPWSTRRRIDRLHPIESHARLLLCLLIG